MARTYTLDRTPTTTM